MDDALRWQAGAQPTQEEKRAAANEHVGATAQFGGDNDEPILIAVINGPVESEMARDALHEAQIPALVKRNPLGPIYGFTFGPFASAEVWVPPTFAEPARDVLVGIGVLPPDENV